MIEKLAKYIVSWQIRKQYIPREKERLYAYAYELLIGQAANLLVACFLAAAFHEYVTVIIYLAAYIPLRSYAGGHHANSYAVCTAVSSGLLCIVCILVKIMPLNYIGIVNIVGTLISGCAIFVLAPVQDHNKPLDQEEKLRYKRRSRVIWLMETFIWIVCYHLEAELVSLAIVFGHITISGMLLAGIIKNRCLSKY